MACMREIIENICYNQEHQINRIVTEEESKTSLSHRCIIGLINIHLIVIEGVSKNY